MSPIVSPGLVTQLRGRSNCVTNCVTGFGDTIQGLLRNLSGSLRSEMCQRLGDRSLSVSIIEADTKIASNLRLNSWLLAIFGVRTSYLR